MARAAELTITSTLTVTGHAAFASSVSVANGLVVSSNITGSLGVQGSTTSAAAAGFVGEYVESVRESSGLLSLSVSGTYSVNGSIILSAGDWDVRALNYFYLTPDDVVTFVQGALSQSSNSVTLVAGNYAILNPSTATRAADVEYTLAMTDYRFTLSSGSTVYNIARAGFTAGTPAVYGIVSARRVR